MPISIRLAAATDISAIFAIRLAVRENRLSDGSPITESSCLPYIDDQAMWVAVVNERIAGFAALDVAGASVWALFVDPAYERLGIGRALLDRLVDDARERKLELLSLTTSPETRADAFYRRAGWTPRGMTEAAEIRFEYNVRRTGA